jgi:hypothetical protein
VTVSGRCGDIMAADDEAVIFHTTPGCANF